MTKTEDLTGRRRILSNVASSWGGHMVFVFFGFVMPRTIDAHVGQEMLGVWDFCWSIVSYIGLANVGLGSSVNRYVAMYRASGAEAELRGAVSSVLAVQLGIALLALLVTLGLSYFVPRWFAARLGTNAVATQWIVLCLGSSVAVQMALDAFRGVVTGCHRWDLHNAVQSGSHALTMLVMIVVLSLGSGIVGIAVVYFIGTTLGELSRMAMAFRVCPELRVGTSYVSGKYLRQMVTFGGKSMLMAMPQLIVIQGTNVAVTATMGPAALAILSRPLGLVRHSETFLNKFTFILAPIVGSLSSGNQRAEQRELYLRSTQWCIAMALPSALFLTISGDALLTVWMGSSYIHPGLMPLLATGLFLMISQGPATQTLIGMNRHGRTGVVCLAITVTVLPLGIMLLNRIGWSLNGAALLIICSLVPGAGVVIPLRACSELDIPVAEYLSRVFTKPLICGVPFAGVLLAVHTVFSGHLIAIVLGSMIAGGLALAAMYWYFMLTEQQRERLVERLPGRARLAQ